MTSGGFQAKLMGLNIMQFFSSSPRTILSGLWEHRQLIGALARREVLSRYRGSSLGLIWAIITPVIMLCVYTFVFSVVFKARWDVNLNSTTEFAMILFVGLIIFNIFSECIGRAPNLIIQNANYVKKVIFPLEILPVVALISCLFQAAVNFIVWALFYCVFFGIPHLELVLLPVFLAPFVMLTIGISWFLASLGTFLRDLPQIIALALTILMFLSPIFYPTSALPPNYQPLLKANPLTLTIEQARELLIYGRIPDFSVLSLQFVISSLIAWLCFAWFQKTRRAFADVL